MSNFIQNKLKTFLNLDVRIIEILLKNRYMNYLFSISRRAKYCYDDYNPKYNYGHKCPEDVITFLLYIISPIICTYHQWTFALGTWKYLANTIQFLLIVLRVHIKIGMFFAWSFATTFEILITTQPYFSIAWKNSFTFTIHINIVI